MLKVNTETKDSNDAAQVAQQPQQQVQRPVQIRLEEDPTIVSLRREVEEDDPDDGLDDGESEKDEEIDDADSATLHSVADKDENPFYVSPSRAAQPLPTWETRPDTKGVHAPHSRPPLPRPRKRSHDELPDDMLLPKDARLHDGAGTPPKKQRRDGAFTPDTSPAKEALLKTPTRARKRSSEELEDDAASDGQNGKRAKAMHRAEAVRT